MGKAVRKDVWLEIGQADGSARDVAKRYGVGLTTVYNARSHIKSSQEYEKWQKQEDARKRFEK